MADWATDSERVILHTHFSSGKFSTSPGLDGLFQFWDRVVSAIIFAGGVDAHDWAIGAGNSAVVNLFPPALWAWPCIFIVQIIVQYVP
jgi:hypothetical protein